MSPNFPVTSQRSEPLQVRSTALDKAVRGEKPAAKDRRPRPGFSQLVHKSPETYNPPSRPEAART